MLLNPKPSKLAKKVTFRKIWQVRYDISQY